MSRSSAERGFRGRYVSANISSISDSGIITRPQRPGILCEAISPRSALSRRVSTWHPNISAAWRMGISFRATGLSTFLRGIAIPFRRGKDQWRSRDQVIPCGTVD